MISALSVAWAEHMEAWAASRSDWTARCTDMLRAAGIEVTTGVLADEAARDLQGFVMKTDLGRPFVTLKLAQSLDGRIATATGESQGITGPHARRMVHAMRLSHDAVMVGGGTARDDDPSLTVRGMGEVRQPVRVVASNSLDIPLGGTLARTAKDVPVWLCHGPAAPTEQNYSRTAGCQNTRSHL